MNKLSKQLSSITDEIEKTEIIKNFPIPNTKEDIISFMSWAVSNYDGDYAASRTQTEDISDAYFAIAEQCYNKSCILFDSNSREFKAIDKEYKNLCLERDISLKNYKKIEKKNQRKKVKEEKRILKEEYSLSTEQRITIISIIVSLFIVCLCVFIPLYNCNIISCNKNAVNIGVDSNHVINKDIDYVIQLFIDNEFTNIEKREMKWDHNFIVNGVRSITVDGKSRFVGNSKFEKTAKIIIYYNAQPEKASIGMSAADIRGKNYKDIVKILKDRGFVYITTDSYNEWFSARDAVRTITINGKTEFTAEEEFSLDSRISLIYFTNNIF